MKYQHTSRPPMPRSRRAVPSAANYGHDDSTYADLDAYSRARRIDAQGAAAELAPQAAREFYQWRTTGNPDRARELTMTEARQADLLAGTVAAEVRRHRAAFKYSRRSPNSFDQDRAEAARHLNNAADHYRHAVQATEERRLARQGERAALDAYEQTRAYADIHTANRNADRADAMREARAGFIAAARSCHAEATEAREKFHARYTPAA